MSTRRLVQALLPAVLLPVSLLVSSAGPVKAADAQAPGQAGAAPEFDMHAPYVRYHFADPDMDFTFGSMVLGAISNGGAETGEAFVTAANIKDGDAVSWQQQWIAMAERVEARGVKSLEGGHEVSAREQLMRASNYYRFGLMAMMPDDPRLPDIAKKSREAHEESRPAVRAASGVRRDSVRGHGDAGLSSARRRTTPRRARRC